MAWKSNDKGEIERDKLKYFLTAIETFLERQQESFHDLNLLVERIEDYDVDRNEFCGCGQDLLNEAKYELKWLSSRKD